MTTYAVAAPHPGRSLAALASPDGGWPKFCSLALSTCVHAAVVGLLLLGLAQEDLLLGGGGGGGFSNGGGMGETAMTVVHMPAPVPISTTPEARTSDETLPVEVALEPLFESQLDPLPLQPSDLAVTLEEPPVSAVPVLRTLEPPLPRQELAAEPVAVMPSPPPAPAVERAPQPMAREPSPLYAFDTVNPIKLRAQSAEQVEESDAVPELPASVVEPLELAEVPAEVARPGKQQELVELAASETLLEAEAPEPQDLEVQAKELTASEADLLREETVAPNLLDSPAEPPISQEVSLNDLVEAAPVQALLSLDAPQLQIEEPTPITAVEPSEAMAQTSLALVETPTAVQEAPSLQVPPSKPERQVALPKVQPRTVAKREVKKEAEPQKQAVLTESAPQAAVQAETKQTGAIAEQAGQGQSKRAGGDQQAGRPGAGGQGPAGAGAGPSGAELNSYASQLAAWLERHKRYPQSARRRGEQGVVTLQFTLDARGHVVARRIVRSSGHERLDREVLALLERASPMPRPPGDAPRFSLAVPIAFSLR
ncbi:MAG: TonB family protein [Kiloniellales bacterium]